MPNEWSPGSFSLVSIRPKIPIPNERCGWPCAPLIFTFLLLWLWRFPIGIHLMHSMLNGSLLVSLILLVPFPGLLRSNSYS